MKRRLLMGFSLFVLVFFLFTPQAQALEFGARAFYWFTTVDSHLRVDLGGVAGTDVNLEDELGMGWEGVPSVEAYAGLGKHHVSVMYTQGDYSGSATLGKPIKFLGKEYAANALLESDFQIRMLDAEYQYDLLNLENILAGFSIGIIGKLKYINGEVELASSTPGSAHDLKETFSDPLPMAGAGVHVGLLLNILEARAKVTAGYSDGLIYDAAADISVTPFPFLDIHAGYKVMKIPLSGIGSADANVQFSGPYLGLTLGF